MRAVLVSHTLCYSINIHLEYIIQYVCVCVRAVYNTAFVLVLAWRAGRMFAGFAEQATRAPSNEWCVRVLSARVHPHIHTHSACTSAARSGCAVAAEAMGGLVVVLVHKRKISGLRHTHTHGTRACMHMCFVSCSTAAESHTLRGETNRHPRPDHVRTITLTMAHTPFFHTQTHTI